ncbi:hypothetical protein ASZ90_015346 [hydrocarbon metagenome]|uniref:Uncharacterized protein n=1 Tax=hydrocarbon metagenome TaxID=938273 RepID=A0A0W8F2G6_9ZZZZ
MGIDEVIGRGGVTPSDGHPREMSLRLYRRFAWAQVFSWRFR